MLVRSLGVSACLLLLPGDDPLHPRGHDREGLPRSAAPFPVWAQDSGHALNRLHALLWIADRTPSEIGASLPAELRNAKVEPKEFFAEKWYFGMRKDEQVTAEDHGLFGGDTRVSPVEDLRGELGAQVRALLAPLATKEGVAAIPELASPLARLLLQWDLLALWWRHEQNGHAAPETLTALARAIVALAQTRATLEGLASGLDELRSTVHGSPSDRTQPYFPASLLAKPAESPWREIAREEKALFHATKSLRSARILVRGKDGADTERIVREAGAATDAATIPKLPAGTEAALVLALVGLDDTLAPVATKVVDEVRIRTITGPAELAPDNGSSRDGLSHWVFLRSRAQSVLGAPQPFRFVPDSAQSLFLEYGTPKHTTYYAQCALCHRQTNSGGQDPAGIKALGRYAKPRIESDPATRLRIAETQFAKIVAKLKERLASAK